MLALQGKHKTLSRGFLAGIVLVCSAYAGQAMANEKTTELHHSVYLGGLLLGGIETRIEQDQNHYKIESAADTSKVFDWAFNWAAEGMSVGAIGLDKFFPRQHEYRSVWNRKVRTVNMEYGKSGAITVEKSIERDDAADKFTPLDPKSLRNSFDPMTAILMITNRLEEGKGCNAELPIFDGQRRYDVQLTEKKERTFKPSRYSVFEGAAHGCKIDVVKKGGFRLESNNNRKFDQEVVVWAAAPVAGGRIVPVRMQLDTEFGRMELHLDRYSEGPLRLVSRNLQ
ncbi:MAG: DUF3108 domain-containing protein [Sneathiella sp.]|nr:DUF3108 domain-containing protein [Sneathiella sp.]